MKSHFKFNKQERSGIFFLLLIIVILQGAYFYAKTLPFKGSSALTINEMEQTRLDSLKSLPNPESFKLFPFNPNYLSDHKGYTLGMSTLEIDRLLAFRKQNKYVNSPKEFQKVTLVSDSLLSILSPYFKFPEWSRRSASRKGNVLVNDREASIQDLNQVTAEDLMRINGIGKTLSKRIIKFRDRLGGFLLDDQLYDVYGLEPQVVKRAFKKFRVLHPPKIEKIDINKATAEEISRLVYISRKVAEDIVTLRNENGRIGSYEELFNINGFPINKKDRIKLYLSL
ncbi:ComEA family DNA-binding protein [Flagellimonas nanhaiensis]|uniref:Helix-hairpin-helix domain-containing protein n=1 Tax=Flagellimonas nanhaiensis TaxID=2292706 RepID=A0A371JM75_9FLAO|nr:helix-hairpin-helix domain-containing protein [Allomuricauda nanhaiensis]RDY58164.1 helix-hairpin-helix domain-containing protein [Allomuricauda nanhaiensis]